MGKFTDLTSQRFGRLVVISFAGLTFHRQSTWLCVCDCGNHVTVVIGSLKNGNTMSCGCLRKELVAKKNWKHGYSKKERLYGLWRGMIQRCTDPNSSHYDRYGGRGIRVYEKWRVNYLTFRSWAHGKGYTDEMTIERKDNNEGYFPDNCTWIPLAVQARNKRTNHMITFNGETKTLVEWSEIMGIDTSLIRYRLKIGWSIKDSLTLLPSDIHKGGSIEKHTTP